MIDDEIEKIEFSFPVLMPLGKKVKINKSKVDQKYFSCPDYVMNAVEGEVIGYTEWTTSSKVVTVRFTKMGSYKYSPCIYNLPNSYLESVK